MPGEFQVIRDYFQRESRAEGLVLGIGDDGAVLRPRAGFDQVVVTDTIVEGRHFPAGFPAEDIGWRAMTVNLSDIAAMGAVPRFAFLNLTAPQPSTGWLGSFANGLFAAAECSGTVLAGGDTTQGPLSVTVTVIGEVPEGMAICRSGARPGDLVCISGTPGEAAAGLELLQSGQQAGDLVQRFRRPQARLALGRELVGRASAAIDVSDGLLVDLGHILELSGVGARIELDKLPVSAALREHAGERAVDYVLAGGDDYELCFCLPPGRHEALRSLNVECEVSVIGEIVQGNMLDIRDTGGRPYAPSRHGWEHFAGDKEG